MSSADVIVIGAGIVGAACADALSAEGLRVVIVESGAVAGGATAAAMGHVVVMDDSEAQMALTRYARGLWRSLAPALPTEVEFDTAGTLWLAADEDELRLVRAKAVSYAAHGVAAEELDPAALARAEPNLRPGLAGALLVPGDIVLSAQAAAQWLVNRARERGSELRVADVASIEAGGVRFADGSGFSAGTVVCAAGTSTTLLIPEARVRPRKGHLALTGRLPGFAHHQLVELGYLRSAHGADAESVAFNIQPRRNGQVVIGSSRQFGVADPAVEAPILRRLLSRAAEYMPSLAGCEILRAWTGFRGATADNLPLIGPCPGRRGVFVAAGHEGLGITTSLATAAMLTDLIQGRTPAIDPAPYLPSRFLVKS
ncbi:MAG TPA: FAD-dependent oxidoreductase [Bryobacteraceae bacterium]|nr:FAD-dependent oxidoreductase [Bryobacteraceae bacterium]